MYGLHPQYIGLNIDKQWFVYFVKGYSKCFPSLSPLSGAFTLVISPIRSIYSRYLPYQEHLLSLSPLSGALNTEWLEWSSCDCSRFRQRRERACSIDLSCPFDTERRSCGKDGQDGCPGNLYFVGTSSYDI